MRRSNQRELLAALHLPLHQRFRLLHQSTYNHERIQGVLDYKTPEQYAAAS